ncbi:U4/U5/U6 small nuclear ribonucleoprotein prp3 [Dimargaris verticillata]|uniref:U4/U5/U6 small nuclear ribonucleoprotein prp3 n=1 Tax=Dimargaris verticillata TaxID=2761393 RepID=A0A9W8EBC2_9FUNG|nr:U4/U5/U6 small nuclear ribonucleoprotein prp3 [Dimargaris verticillata]
MPQPPPGMSAEIQRKLQEARERIEAMKRKANPTNVVPQRPALPATATASASTERDQAPKRLSGLNTAIHPSLMISQETGQIEIKALSSHLAPLPKPSFATVKANRQAASKLNRLQIVSPSTEFSDVTKNPYFDPNLGIKSAAPQTRKRKGFQFVSKGHYVEKGDQLRAETQLAQLRQKISENVKKAGMETDDASSTIAFRKPPPPEAEWWDVPLLKNKTYDDVGTPNALIHTPDTLITHYIQHPVPTKSVVQGHQPIVKPLILTKKERKKLRRQRRAELLREKQDKIRLGLLPPDPPKVKLGNLMRVLANESVQDPTKVEAEVRRQVAARREEHERQNKERQLTDEQRREKKKQKLAVDESRGLCCAVFKVQHLAHPQHRFKVEVNAKQLNLTGVAILNSQQCLVVVEGGAKSIKAYKKLMLRRIQWDTDPSDGESEADESSDDEEKANYGSDHQRHRARQGQNSGDTANDGPNYCALIWEGQIDKRHFKPFATRGYPTDGMAKACLAQGKLESVWDVAKRHQRHDMLHSHSDL